MSGSQAFGRCGVGMEKRWSPRCRCGHSLHSVPGLEPGGNSRVLSLAQVWPAVSWWKGQADHSGCGWKVRLGMALKIPKHLHGRKVSCSRSH